MGHVDNIIVVSLGDTQMIRNIFDASIDGMKLNAPVPTEHTMGARKHMECDIMLTAVNYLDEGQLLQACRDASNCIDFPEAFRVLLCREHDEGFSFFWPAKEADSVHSSS